MDSDEAGRLVDARLELTAGAMGRKGDGAFARWMAEWAREHDPRRARYWELIGALKGWRVDRELNAAWEWLFAALEARMGAPASKMAGE